MLGHVLLEPGNSPPAATLAFGEVNSVERVSPTEKADFPPAWGRELHAALQI